LSKLEKQNMVHTTDMSPRNSVQPRLHTSLEIRNAIQENDIWSIKIIESLAYYGNENDWRSVWGIADALKREISLLFDDNGSIWVDIGTPGMVRLSPPLGCQLPLRLWVHTHPWDAYWSATDQRTLATVSGILERALVLGHDHLVHTVHTQAEPVVEEDCRLSTNGLLMHWSAEEAQTYSLFKEGAIE